ncbi:MAG: alkaline phosphatase family protein [bacterium]
MISQVHSKCLSDPIQVSAIRLRGRGLLLAVAIVAAAFPWFDCYGQDPSNSEPEGEFIRTIPLPDDFRDDLTFTSEPSVRIGPLMECQRYVLVSGAIPGADVFVQRSSSTSESPPPDGSAFDILSSLPDVQYQRFHRLEVPPLVPGQWIRAEVQIESGNFTSNWGKVNTTSEVYPNGRPTPRFEYPLYECGQAARIKNCSPNADREWWLKATHDDYGDFEENRQTIQQDVHYWNESWSTPFDEVYWSYQLGMRSQVRTTICGDPGPETEWADIVPYPYPKLPEPVLEHEEVYEGQAAVRLSGLVPGAVVTLKRADPGTGQLEFVSKAQMSTTESWFTFPNTDLVTGSYELDQMLCPGSTGPPLTFTTLDCSEMKAPEIMLPEPGDYRIFITKSVPGARIIVRDEGGELLGAYWPPEVGLIRSLNNGDVLTIAQSLNGCLGAEALEVRVCHQEYLLLLIIDGLHPDHFMEYLDKHQNNNKSGFWLVSEGRGRIVARNSQGVFPSHTISNMASLVTGMWQDRTGIISTRYYEWPKVGDNTGLVARNWADPAIMLGIMGFWDHFDDGAPWFGAINGTQHICSGSGTLDHYLHKRDVKTIYQHVLNNRKSSHVYNHFFSIGARHPGPDYPEEFWSSNDLYDGWTVPAIDDYAYRLVGGNNNPAVYYKHLDEVAFSNAKSDIWEWRKEGVGLPNLMTIYCSAIDAAAHLGGPSGEHGNYVNPWDILNKIDSDLHDLYLAIPESVRRRLNVLVVSDHSLTEIDPGSNAAAYSDGNYIEWDYIWEWAGWPDRMLEDLGQYLGGQDKIDQFKVWFPSQHFGLDVSEASPTQVRAEFERFTGSPYYRQERDGGTACLYGWYSQETVERLMEYAEGRILFALRREWVTVQDKWVKTTNVSLITLDKWGNAVVQDALAVPDKRLGMLVKGAVDSESFPDVLLVASADGKEKFGSPPKPDSYPIDVGDYFPEWVDYIPFFELPEINLPQPFNQAHPQAGHHGFLYTTRNTFVLFSHLLKSHYVVDNVRIIDVAPTIAEILELWIHESNEMDGTSVVDYDVGFLKVNGSAFPVSSGNDAWNLDKSGEFPAK